MGGNIFKTAGPGGTPLEVPRMKPDIYNNMAVDLQSKLQKIFLMVTVPREPPGKPDYGDIDILVSGSLYYWDALILKDIIGATHVSENGRTISFAVPYPAWSHGYAQVDIEVAPGAGTPDSESLFKWTQFIKSDGGLLQLIGICHRGLGIKNNDRGLHVCLEEIEPYNRKKSLLFLSRDPDEVMRFYGYDAEKYWDGFESEEDLFKWVTSSRFFDCTLFENRSETSNDRSRQKKRQMYSRFIEEFMPNHMNTRNCGQSWTRQQVLEEALNVFDKHNEYKAMIEEHVMMTWDAEIHGRVKDLLPPTNSRNLTLRALRRWVDFAEGKPFISSEAKLEQCLWSRALANGGSVKDFLEWVGQNWQKVRALEQQRTKGAKSAPIDVQDNTTEISAARTPSLALYLKTPSTVSSTPKTPSRSEAERPVDHSDFGKTEEAAQPSAPQASLVLDLGTNSIVSSTPNMPNRSEMERPVDHNDMGDKEISAQPNAPQANASQANASQAGTTSPITTPATTIQSATTYLSPPDHMD